ncbi:putative 39S ribosomal protein L10, mitochondrial [Apostichopus japonicus]|uniref:Large ribosomal subunit protein uL10m n=1 Tax=Stichopus japonicus TaxID=307972 RepID=A0A2G8JI02_STIJA|nr:putative 39S ribosomal protein L10, mitochondrial [Apostichopus japonicus]
MKAVNTRMKKPMHIMRAKLMKLTEYEKPKDLRPMAETCTVFLRSLEAKIDNPTQTFYAKMCRRSLESSKLVAVFHNEGMDAEDTIRLRRRLMKHNMDVKIWGMQVVQEAIHETKFRHFEDILHRFNLYVISEEPAVLELLKVAKRSGRIHLLGGLVEDRFMSPKQMQEYSLSPSLEVARGQLAGILNSSLSRTHSLLQSNQQNLATNLEQLAKGKVNTDGKEETEV